MADGLETLNSGEVNPTKKMIDPERILNIQETTFEGNKNISNIAGKLLKEYEYQFNN